MQAQYQNKKQKQAIIHPYKQKVKINKTKAQSNNKREFIFNKPLTNTQSKNQSYKPTKH